ncbi:MAG: NYN domain-containing protein [bacterium]|nr:NYN domain-containing protein [bacterium]
MRLFKKPPILSLSDISNRVNDLNIRIQKLEYEYKALKNHNKKWENLKVGVFVDVQNMFYAAKKNYESRLDYMKLLHYAVKRRRLIKATAYMIENPEIDQSGFVSLLEHHSFDVRRKSLIQRADGSQKGDYDMEIALEILNMVNDLDVVALVSGDGDFVSLVEAVKARGPRVEVYSFPHNTAMELKEVADDFFPIGDDLLYGRNNGRDGRGGK